MSDVGLLDFTDGNGCAVQAAAAVSDGKNYYLLVGNNYRISLVLNIDLSGYV